jgi:predicted lipid-binding transport protein (Tim44 family)
MHTPAVGAPAITKRSSGPTPKHAVNPLGTVAAVVGALAGYLAMNSLSPAAKGRVIGGAIAGTIIGLLPFFVGRHMKQPKLATQALTCCCVAGVALGMVLAGPVALIFTLVLVSRRPQG